MCHQTYQRVYIFQVRLEMSLRLWYPMKALCNSNCPNLLYCSHTLFNQNDIKDCNAVN